MIAIEVGDKTRGACASRLGIVLAGVLAAIILAGCGGSGDAAPAACETHPPLPVEKVFYPNRSAPVGAPVSVFPMIDVTSGNGLDNAILRFDLIGGSLPGGLSLNPSTGQISGIVGRSPGSFSYTVRVTAECFTGAVTTNAVFFVS
ncbi:Ig domain-containing protein [Noviherbaspirillum sp.]|uniref:Ig domain-containing protein n=1 Tax=Noviherbaspirillum sp. TaxID=1926288 RepID=UPI002D5F2C7D|nr:Ig domain-containing protein [Noviherbaspirillum sp.]HZW20204.1 Ig domain-containing protein [Noviherbaspirillum sp.]